MLLPGQAIIDIYLTNNITVALLFNSRFWRPFDWAPQMTRDTTGWTSGGRQQPATYASTRKTLMTMISYRLLVLSLVVKHAPACSRRFASVDRVRRFDWESDRRRLQRSASANEIRRSASERARAAERIRRKGTKRPPADDVANELQTIMSSQRQNSQQTWLFSREYN